MVRRSSVAFLLRMSSPPMVIVPEVGSWRRLIIFSVVVLPQPEGPMNMTISPAGTVRDSPSTAGTFCPE